MVIRRFLLLVFFSSSSSPPFHFFFTILNLFVLLLKAVTALQALARGYLARLHLWRKKQVLQGFNASICLCACLSFCVSVRLCACLFSIFQFFAFLFSLLLFVVFFLPSNFPRKHFSSILPGYFQSCLFAALEF